MGPSFLPSVSPIRRYTDTTQRFQNKASVSRGALGTGVSRSSPTDTDADRDDDDDDDDDKEGD